MVQCKYQSGLSGKASYHHLAWRLFDGRLPQEDIPRGNSFLSSPHPLDPFGHNLPIIAQRDQPAGSYLPALLTSPRLTFISTTEVLVGFLRDRIGFLGGLSAPSSYPCTKQPAMTGTSVYRRNPSHLTLGRRLCICYCTSPIRILAFYHLIWANLLLWLYR